MKFIISTLLLLVISLPVVAQDTVKVSAGFVSSDFGVNDIQGVSAELDAKILKSGKFRIGGVFQYVRPQVENSADVDTYSFGPQVSYDVFGGRISLFGRGLFGVTTDYNGTNTFTRTYGFGGDVNLGHIFIRPFVMDFQRFEGVPVTVNRFGAGAGIRF